MLPFTASGSTAAACATLTGHPKTITIPCPLCFCCRFRESPVLPFNAFGTMAIAREEFDSNSGSSQFFWLLKARSFCCRLLLYMLLLLAALHRHCVHVALDKLARSGLHC